MSTVTPSLCKDCGHLCLSLNNCLKYQEFNMVVEQAQAMAKLKKSITGSVPHFKGLKKWLKQPTEDFIELDFSNNKIHYSKFITLTFDPKKFSLNELTQPTLLDNYIKNCLLDLQNLFKDKTIMLVREFHKTGIPHYHLLCNFETPLEQNTCILRLRYFLSAKLTNKRSVHLRPANEYAINYISKSNTKYLNFKQPMLTPLEQGSIVDQKPSPQKNV